MDNIPKKDRDPPWAGLIKESGGSLSIISPSGEAVEALANFALLPPCKNRKARRED